MMDVTSRFVLDFARRFAAVHPGAAMLDFGCGSGRLVAAARASGLNMVGADVFYGGSHAHDEARAGGLLDSVVLEIRDGTLPLPASSLDLVTNNQVMEHVESLDGALCDIHRVLKPGGTLLSLFPSRDVWREGHIGIPFAHRLRRGSRSRFLYTWALRRMGLGTWKEQSPTPRQWALDKLAWIDAYTHYRSRDEILGTYARHFQSRLCEPDYIRYRLCDVPARAWLSALLDVPMVPAIAAAIFRKLAFLVIVSKKAEQ